MMVSEKSVSGFEKSVDTCSEPKPSRKEEADRMVLSVGRTLPQQTDWPVCPISSSFADISFLGFPGLFNRRFPWNAVSRGQTTESLNPDY